MPLHLADEDFLFSNVQELAKRFRDRSLSPREVTRAYLTRIDATDFALRAFLTVVPERALDDAARAETELRAGIDRGLLHGIPVALKDVFDTAGIRTCANSQALAGRVPTEDSAVAARLRRAGSVLLGKLKMHEFALGPVHEDDWAPPARNPWDLRRVPGGSSSGSAVAVAAGLCAVSMGSDTGGSIRTPAALTGVVGLKPTYGLVSRRGLLPLSWTLDHAGPMARSVEDAAALLSVVAGHDPGDSTPRKRHVPDYVTGLDEPVRGLRLAVPAEFVESVEGLTDDVRRAFWAAIEQLKTLGIEVLEIELPARRVLDAVLRIILLTEAAATHEELLRTRANEIGRGFKQSVLPGLVFTGTDYLGAVRGLKRIRAEFEELLKTADLIATPTVPWTAPLAAEARAPTRGPFTGVFNLTGQPSVSVPSGLDENGLPIGLLLSGRPFQDETVLRVAAAYQRSTSWHLRHPRVALGAVAVRQLP